MSELEQSYSLIIPYAVTHGDDNQRQSALQLDLGAGWQPPTGESLRGGFIDRYTIQ